MAEDWSGRTKPTSATTNAYRLRERQVLNPVVPLVPGTSRGAGVRAAMIDQSDDGADYSDPYDTSGPQAYGDVGVGDTEDIPSGQASGESYGADYLVSGRRLGGTADSIGED